MLRVAIRSPQWRRDMSRGHLRPQAGDPGRQGRARRPAVPLAAAKASLSGLHHVEVLGVAAIRPVHAHLSSSSRDEPGMFENSHLAEAPVRLYLLGALAHRESAQGLYALPMRALKACPSSRECTPIMAYWGLSNASERQGTRYLRTLPRPLCRGGRASTLRG